LLTVDQIADAIPEITGAALLAEAEGDVARVDAAIASAKLRPREEIEPLMLDAAKANALAATAAPDKAHRDIPPGSVFYVLPWLLSDDHPWGVQVELRAGPELGGMSFTMDGVKLPS